MSSTTSPVVSQPQGASGHGPLLPTKPNVPGRSLFSRLGTFPAAVCSVLVLIRFVFARGGVGDPDIFWHLRNAQDMVARHHFPSFDTYSFTVRGTPWIAHEWLSELFYYAAYRALHLQGLELLAAFLPAAAVAIVFYMAYARNSDPLGAAAASAACIVLMLVGSGPRMHHFGWLCFTVLLAILQKYRLTRKGPLWAIPIVFCLWINLHGSWPYGFAVFAIIGLAGLIKSDLGRLQASPWSRDDQKRLSFVALASAAAVFVNPFGYKLVWYPADLLLHQKLNLQVIEEWRAVSFNQPIGRTAGVILVVLLLCAAASKVRWRVDDLALTIFVLYCGFSHQRMLLPAGIVLATVIAPYLYNWTTYDSSHERTTFNLMIVAMVLVIMVVMYPREKYLEMRIEQKYPAQAINYLRSHGGGGRLLNFYEWGGYLEWMMPEQTVFIDSRADIFEYRGVLKDYDEFTRVAHPERILQKYQIDKVVFTPDAPICTWFDRQKEWRVAYRDGESVIYERTPGVL